MDLDFVKCFILWSTELLILLPKGFDIVGILIIDIMKFNSLKLEVDLSPGPMLLHKIGFCFLNLLIVKYNLFSTIFKFNALYY